MDHIQYEQSSSLKYSAIDFFSSFPEQVVEKGQVLPQHADDRRLRQLYTGTMKIHTVNNIFILVRGLT
jgi:hypothetical protein